MRLAVLQSYSDQNAGPLLLFEGGKMSNSNEQDNQTERQPSNPTENTDQKPGTQKDLTQPREEKPLYGRQPDIQNENRDEHEHDEHEHEHEHEQQEPTPIAEGRPVERSKGTGRPGARGTAAMDPKTRQEVARKGGLVVSRNKQHMAEIGRKGGQSVSKNREHMALIGRKGGAASRRHR